MVIIIHEIFSGQRNMCVAAFETTNDKFHNELEPLLCQIGLRW